MGSASGYRAQQRGVSVEGGRGGGLLVWGWGEGRIPG
jgi:hypothetical protein